MLKFRIKKGFTILEIMAGFSIFSILFLTAITLQVNNMRMKIYNEKLYNYRLCLETLRNRMFYNSDYNMLLEIKNDNKQYINIDYIDKEILKACNIKQALNSFVQNNTCYIIVRITGTNVLKAELELHAIILEKDEVIKCELYKGNY